jgi:hypothetical protein
MPSWREASFASAAVKNVVWWAMVSPNSCESVYVTRRVKSLAPMRSHAALPSLGLIHMRHSPVSTRKSDISRAQQDIHWFWSKLLRYLLLRSLEQRQFWATAGTLEPSWKLMHVNRLWWAGLMSKNILKPPSVIPEGLFAIIWRNSMEI